MADYKATDTEFTAVANAIRTKGGTSGQLVWPNGFVSAVNAIPTGGGGGGDWNDPLVRNWDFSNPLNTRELSEYGASAVTINGWRDAGYTHCKLLSGGIEIWTDNASNNSNWYNNFKADDNAMIGKQLTISALINNELFSESLIMTSGTGQKILINLDGGYPNGLSFWINRNSAHDYAVGFFSYPNTPQANYLIQAVKLEYGDSQTLCDIVNGVPVLKKHQDNDVEMILGKYMSVNW